MLLCLEYSFFLNHPNILTLLGTLQKAHSLFLIMNYVKGQTLHTVIFGDSTEVCGHLSCTLLIVNIVFIVAYFSRKGSCEPTDGFLFMFRMAVKNEYPDQFLLPPSVESIVRQCLCPMENRVPSVKLLQLLLDL